VKKWLSWGPYHTTSEMYHSFGSMHLHFSIVMYQQHMDRMAPLGKYNCLLFKTMARRFSTGTPFFLLSNVSLSISNLSLSCANSESYDMKGGSSLQSKW